MALFLAGANMTLPKKMFDNILMEIDPTIAAVSVMQILLVSVVLVLIGRFGRGLSGQRALGRASWPTASSTRTSRRCRGGGNGGIPRTS